MPLSLPLAGGRTVPPRVPPSVVRRPLLEERLAMGLRGRLTTVIADAGFGKSTLLATWAGANPCAWYTLDERDDALPVLASHLVAALHRVAGTLEPDDARALLAAGEGSAIGPGPADAFVEALCAALDRAAARDTVLVLDNVQDVGAQGVAARVLERLVRQAPASLHVVLVSRSAIPFPIERLRGRGEVCAIEAAALALSPDEVADVLATALDAPSARELAGAVHGLTAGWPAAVILALERLRSAPPAGRSDIARHLVRGESPLFGYLAEEVFAKETQAVRELLRRVAPLGRFTLELCRELGILAPEAAVSDLTRRGLFIQPQDEWFTLHALVREFAERAWPLAPEERVDLHRRAAAWSSERGAHSEALRLLALAGDHRGIAAVIAAHGGALVAHGSAQTVIDHAALVPPDARTRDLELAVGEAHTIRGDPDPALACFQRAAGEGAVISAAVAWRMIEAHVLKNDLEGGRSVLERAEPDASTPRDLALFHAWRAQLHRRLGETEATAAAASAALEAAGSSADDRALAAAHNVMALSAGMTGDNDRAETHLRLALAAAERARDTVQTVQILSTKGTMEFERSAYGDAITTYERGARLAELAGFAAMHAQARMNLGLLRWCRGELDEASVEYAEAVRLYRSAGSREVSYAIVGQGDVHRERGDLALARNAYQEGLALGEASGDRQALVPALYQLAKVVVVDDPEEAIGLAQRAVDYGWPDLGWALNALGWILLIRGEHERALVTARHADAVAREHQDRFGLAESLELQAMASQDVTARRRLLEDARAVWRELANPIHEAAVDLALARLATGSSAQVAADRALRQLRALGVRVSATGPAGLLRFAAPDMDSGIEIRTFGGFQVLREGSAVPPSEWQSRKARDLLKILVTRRGRPSPRDTLAALLWPAEESDALAARLSVALSTVRAVLDPDRQLAADHFISADASAVGLRVDRIRIDVEVFLANADAAFALPPERAGEARDLLETAEAAYAGDLLEEDPYADWAVALREEARAVYVRVAQTLADIADGRGDSDAAAHHLLRVLASDPYDERAHLRLVGVLEAGGRHGDARRAYRAYAARMEEIGVEAAAFPRHVRPGAALSRP
jgi:ATP/maltotriose-dependent transcriptional regulator MalT/DNA-binding SARP family transcriptional activator